MKIDKDLILAFDIQDTKKIINLIKEKKRKILAITPNAYEELNKNGFEDIVSPYDLNEHLHEQIAEDNILFRDKLDNINQNSSFLTLCDESFKNILGLNKAAVQQKALQDSILTTLQSNERINRVLEGLEGNKAAQAKFLFNEVSRTTTEYNKQLGLAKQLASTLGQMGVVGGGAGLALGGRRGIS